MKDYSKAETKVVTSDANRGRTEVKGYTPARGRAHGASETGSSARLGGSGSSGNKSRNHRYGGFRGTALVVLLTFIMTFASLLSAFADDLKNTVPVDENYTTNITTYTKPSDEKAKQQTQNGTTVGTTTLAGDTYVKGKPAPSNIQQSTSPGSVTTFAAGLPLSTIFIDTSKVGQNVKPEFKPLTTDPGIVFDSNSYRGDNSSEEDVSIGIKGFQSYSENQM